MHDHVDQSDSGRIDLSGARLRDLAGLTGSVLDRELVKVLDRDDTDQKSAGFQNRI